MPADKGLKPLISINFVDAATAMAWIPGAAPIGFTLIQLQRLGRMEFRGAK